MFERLLPCPFCEGDAVLAADFNGRYRKWFVFVKCEKCGSRGKTFMSYSDPGRFRWSNSPCNNAVKSWNKRAYIDPDDLNYHMINNEVDLNVLFKQNEPSEH